MNLEVKSRKVLNEPDYAGPIKRRWVNFRSLIYAAVPLVTSCRVPNKVKEDKVRQVQVGHPAQQPTRPSKSSLLQAPPKWRPYLNGMLRRASSNKF